MFAVLFGASVSKFAVTAPPRLSASVLDMQIAVIAACGLLQ